MTEPNSSNSGNPQIFQVIEEDNVETLSELVKSKRELLQTYDKNGDNLLHFSIIKNKYKSFKYLLSLDYFNIETKNSYHLTALYQALKNARENQQFAVDLLHKGANIFLHNPTKPLLHLALEQHCISIAGALLKKGADIDEQDFYKRTPLHCLFDNKMGLEAVREGVGLMLFYGADTTVCDHNGNLPFDLAVLYDQVLQIEQWNLFFSSFDKDCKYEMSLEVLFELLEQESPLFFEISDFVSDVIFPKGICMSLRFLFKTDPRFLAILIQKFDYLIAELLCDQSVFFGEVTPLKYENWMMLLESELKDDMFQFIKRQRINNLIDRMEDEGSDKEEIARFIFFLLSYGLEVYEMDLESVYKKYGYCDLFKFLLHMDLNVSPCDVMPKIIFDVSGDGLDYFLDHLDSYTETAVEHLLSFFARPKLRDFCKLLECERINVKVADLPIVPCLVELARDATRTHLIRKYGLDSPKKFYTFLKNLPINEYYKKIISFEKRLYYHE